MVSVLGRAMDGHTDTTHAACLHATAEGCTQRPGEPPSPWSKKKEKAGVISPFYF